MFATVSRRSMAGANNLMAAALIVAVAALGVRARGPRTYHPAWRVLLRTADPLRKESIP
jgi:hypothetical protein